MAGLIQIQRPGGIPPSYYENEGRNFIAFLLMRNKKVHGVSVSGFL